MSCPNCKANNLSILQGDDGYIYHAICLTCTYELTLDEKLSLEIPMTNEKIIKAHEKGEEG